MSPAPLGHTRKREPAHGVPSRPGYLRLIVDLEEETFAELRRRALAENTSVAEQIRAVVEWGLESAR